MSNSARSLIAATGCALLASACSGSLSLSPMHASAFAVGPGGGPAPAATPVADLDVAVEVRLDFYGVPLAGADDVVFVLDRSGSMGTVSAGVSGGALGMTRGESAVASLGGSLVNRAVGSPLPSKLDAAKSELIRTLRVMPDGTRFGVIFFDDEISALSPRMWVLDPHTRDRAESFIRGIRPGGSTAAVPALRLAYRMGARRVILLSDGLANTGGTGADLLRDARREIAHGVQIDTVGVGLDQDDSLLVALAAESGGQAVMR